MFSTSGGDYFAFKDIQSVVFLQRPHSLGSEYGNDIADNFLVRVHRQVGAFGSLG